MVKKERRERRCPTFLMKHTRVKIDQINSRIPNLNSTDHSNQINEMIEDLRLRISIWPRFAAGVTAERRKEIRYEGG